MGNLINTIVEDAKPGNYVSYDYDNPYKIKSTFAPRLYELAAKVVYYCYDDGSVSVGAIGEDDFNLKSRFYDGREIETFHNKINGFDCVRCLNSALDCYSVEEVIEIIDDNDFNIDKKYFAPIFIQLIEHLRNMDSSKEPEPFKNYGFKWKKDIDSSGTCYLIYAVVDKEAHGEIVSE